LLDMTSQIFLRGELDDPNQLDLAEENCAQT
jgi:hypothetical protein